MKLFSQTSARPNKAWATLTRWIPVLFLLAIIVGSGLLFGWLVFATDVFVVQAVTVLDARDHTAQAIKNIVEAEQGIGSQTSNIFFIQTDSIANKITRELPQIRTVHVLRKLPSTLRVVVQEKQPTVLLVSNGNYYFVDDMGVPFEEASLEKLPGIILPIVKNDDVNAKVTIGAPAIATSFVSFITQVQQELPDIVGAEVAEIHIPSLAAREVHVLLSSNWRLLFDVTREPAGQLEVLKRVVTELITPEEQTQLEYIDLRIKDRVYYRSGVTVLN